MGAYVRPDKAIRETIIKKMEEDRDAIQAAFALATHIEHDIDFKDHGAPLPPQIRGRVALAQLTPVIGAAVGVPAGPGVAVDITVDGGASIIGGPVPLLGPMIPTPLFFTPGTIIAPGALIEYTVIDGGDLFENLCMNVQFIKNLDELWEPVP
jgi:hypothetical protein